MPTVDNVCTTHHECDCLRERREAMEQALKTLLILYRQECMRYTPWLDDAMYDVMMLLQKYGIQV